MKTTLIENAEVKTVFKTFPSEIKNRLLQVRELILDTGYSIDPIGKVEETLKWGDPSYSTIAGSPVRLGWNKKTPEKFGIYFHCQTKLVSTFRVLYPQTFTFEGNRAMVFHKSDPIPEQALKHCIELALAYHKLKDKPLLGTQ